MRRLARHAVGELPQRREVVEDPERPAMRGRHEIVGVDAQVAHTHARQVELQRLPPRAVVHRDVHAGLRCSEQQTAPDDVLPDRARVRSHGNARVDARPRPAVIVRPVQIRTEVVELVARGGHVRDRRVVARRLDAIHARVLRHPLRRHLLPAPASVARDVHAPVVRTRPQQPLRRRRLGQRIYGRVPLRARHVAVDIAAAAAERRGVGVAEIGRDPFPRASLVVRPPHILRRDIERARIVRRQQYGEGPLEAVGHVLRRHSIVVAEPDADVAALSGTLVVARENTGVAAAVGDIRVARVHGDVRVLAAGHSPPVALADDAVVGPRRNADGRVVLLRAVETIRPLRIGDDVIELRRRLVHDR